MKSLLVILSLLIAAPAFAGPASPKKSTPSKQGNGFVYESLTKIGDKAIIKWPRVNIGGELAYIHYETSNSRDQGDAICRAYGYRSGVARWSVVSDANYVRLERSGSVEDFAFGSEQYSAAYSVTCSDAPSADEPRNY